MAFPESSSRHWTCKGVYQAIQTATSQCSDQNLLQSYANLALCSNLRLLPTIQRIQTRLFPGKWGTSDSVTVSWKFPLSRERLWLGTSQIHKADAAKMDVENRSCVFASLSWASGHPVVRVSAAQACELAYWTLKINTQIQCQPSPMASLAFTPYGGTLILCK